MNLLLIASTLAGLQAERATAASFRGERDGKLVVLEVPETGTLDFFVVKRVRAEDAETVFEVYDSGEPARPVGKAGAYVMRARITGETTGVAERESPFTARAR